MQRKLYSMCCTLLCLGSSHVVDSTLRVCFRCTLLEGVYPVHVWTVQANKKYCDRFASAFASPLSRGIGLGISVVLLTGCAVAQYAIAELRALRGDTILHVVAVQCADVPGI